MPPVNVGNTLPTYLKTVIVDDQGNILGTSASPIRIDPTGTTTQPVSGGGGSGTQYADGTTQATPTGTVALGKNASNVLHSLALSAAGNLNVNLAEGTITGGNAAASATGAAVPASADYGGINIAGNLTGRTGFSLGSQVAASVAIVDGSGNQITTFGGGTQFADNAASGATPTGTLSMGWDSANSKVRALKVDASQNLNVNIAANSFGTFTITGTVTANQGGAPWSENITQFGGTNISTGTGASGAGIPRVTISNDSVISSITNTVTIAGTVTANAGTGTFNVADANLELSQGSTTSGQKGPLVQGAVTTNAPSYTTAQTDPLSLDTSGLLRVSIKDTPSNTNNFNVNLAASAATVTVTGTVTANQGGAPWSDDVTDRAARLLGVVYGSQGQQLKQTGTNFNLQVELATGGALYDARQIRALTSADVVSAVQSGNWNVNQAIGVAGFEKITDGTNTAAVKAASTAPAATDPALVVSISPNSSLTATNPSVGPQSNTALPGSATLVGLADPGSGNFFAMTGFPHGTVTALATTVLDGSGVQLAVGDNSVPPNVVPVGILSMGYDGINNLIRNLTVDTNQNLKVVSLNAAQETGGNLASVATSSASSASTLTGSRSIDAQSMVILESIRRAIVALACEGGRNKPTDFDPSVISQEEGTDDWAD